MARPLRIEKAGGWYHITARGNERRVIFRDDQDRRHFLELLGRMVFRFKVRLHCFVLMENHYHLLLELSEVNLSRAVQWLNVSYSIWYNRRHERSGHLFQGRFKSVIVSPEEWALELSRYLHLNPVRIGSLGLGKRDRQAQAAGLAVAPDTAQLRERILRLRRYPWSSYRAYIGLGKPWPWLDCQSVLGLGGGPRGEQRRNYRGYVERAVREGLENSPFEDVKEQVILGGSEFLEGLRAQVHGDEQEQRAAKRLVEKRPAFERVVAAVEEIKGEKWNQFRDRHGDRGRDMVLYLGRRACGMKLGELAKAAGLRNYAVVATNVSRYELSLQRDRSERRLMREVTQLLNCKM